MPATDSPDVPISTDSTSLDRVVESYATVTDCPRPSRIFTVLDGLAGGRSEWTITFRPPSDDEPHGALLLWHAAFNEYTSIAIISTDIDSPERDSDQDVTYDVYNPMETDILPVAIDLENPLEAVKVAVSRANNEYNRQTSPSLVERTTSAIASLMP